LDHSPSRGTGGCSEKLVGGAFQYHTKQGILFGVQARYILNVVDEF
jgi:hypothetical protein